MNEPTVKKTGEIQFQIAKLPCEEIRNGGTHSHGYNILIIILFFYYFTSYLFSCVMLFFFRPFFVVYDISSMSPVSLVCFIHKVPLCQLSGCLPLQYSCVSLVLCRFAFISVFSYYSLVLGLCLCLLVLFLFDRSQLFVIKSGSLALAPDWLVFCIWVLF